MSIHSSLKLSLASGKQRTVLKRIERVKQLMEKGLFKDEDVFKLPKTKIIKIKVKKIAKEEKPQEAAAAGAAAPAAGSAAAASASKDAKSSKAASK